MEKFKDINKLEGKYQISNFGRIKSFCRKEVRILKNRLDKKGYSHYLLNGKEYKAHRLVLETFVGPCPNGLMCCHNDGNKQNNHVSNLRWDSQVNNIKDMKKHGQDNYLKGEEHGAAKLTLQQVKEIRALKGKLTQVEIGKKYNIVQGQVSRILRNVNWKNL